MPKSLDQIMAELAAQGVSVNVSTRDPNSVSGRIGQAAKDAGNYWCKLCDAGVEGCMHPIAETQDSEEAHRG